MIAVAILALHAALQVTPPTQQTIVRDSTVGDSTKRRAPIRRAVTAELLASAFRDPDARNLFNRGRDARVRQDSSLQSYDAKARYRLSVTAAIGSVTMEKLAYRQEGAARVQWNRGVGAHVEVTGGRVSIPAIGMAQVDRDALESFVADVGFVPIPYFPGYEPMWVGSFAAGPEVNEREMINPLANGAEAYYTYQAGDSLTIRPGGGQVIRVRQIDFRPREAGFSLLVGSLWLDQESGQLVRAAYRLSAPGGANVSVSDTSGKEHKIIGTIIKALTPAMVAQISAVVVEYGRFDGFWLPKSQTMQGFVKASFARVPVTIENNFGYESVNATPPLPAIHVDTMRRRDTTKANRSIRQCDSAATRVVTSYKADGKVAVEMRIPCDLDKLMQSPDLPKSAYRDDEQIFGTPERAQMISEALSMLDQAPISFGNLPPPRFTYGVSMTRYNRIEGFSTGLQVTQLLGGGLDVSASGRLGTADHTPRGELSLGRTNMRKTVRIGGYSRLASVSDWESPLSFGSSLSAFFFGRDDGFYYRTTGAELLLAREDSRLAWRAFHEMQRTAVPKTDFSVGGSFGPNILAADGRYTGGSVRWSASRGLDPRSFRISSDLRLEAATGDSSFGRGSLDLTVSRPIILGFDASLTAAGGTSVGGVPMQRRWFLGGTQTVRGILPDTAQSGNAFWLGRFELARTMAFFRPSLFGDIGWAGDRTKLNDVGRPLSGAGVGFSFLDGAIRLDVARGLYPKKQTVVSFYLGSRF